MEISLYDCSGHKADKQLWRVVGRFTQVVQIFAKITMKKMFLFSAYTAEKPCEL